MYYIHSEINAVTTKVYVITKEKCSEADRKTIEHNISHKQR